MDLYLLSKKWVSVAMILLLMGMYLIPVTAQENEQSSELIFTGKWWYVGGSGPGNYSTIQEGVDSASDGDTVFVFDDSSPYYESVQISRSINLVGENVDTTTIINSDLYIPVLKIVVNNVVVTGFTIIGESEGYGFKPGIEIVSSFNCIFCNNISSSVGIRLEGGMNNSIFNNNIFGTYYDGISGYSLFLKIENNTICSKGVGYGIFMYTISHMFFHNNIIIQTSTAPCMRIDGSLGQSIISNNTLYHGVLWYNFGPSTDYIRNNTVDGKPLVFLYNVSNRCIDFDTGQVILCQCENVTITNQNFSHLEYPVQLHDSMNCTLIDNVISNAKNYRSIDITSSDKIRFMHNTLVSSRVDFLYCTNLSVSKNTITNSYEGINFGGCTFSTISYNNWIDNVHDVSFKYECRNCSMCCNNFVSSKLIYQFYCISIYDPVSSNNTFTENYWGRMRLFPKPLRCILYEGDWQIPTNLIWSWYFDWKPAKKSYDILA